MVYLRTLSVAQRLAACDPQETSAPSICAPLRLTLAVLLKCFGGGLKLLFLG
jgi:hypothetical protein